ncbi:MAG: DegT/DnrJ/EryC1/StrS family aminotransferase [Actinomycetota bacterium]|nr:DegT/DnrJ/EryC1/StrS family aminotransferase [Actinomycetota bacterium]
MIPIYKALIDTDEVDAATNALRQGWLGMGSAVADFEQAVEKAIQAGARRAVAVSTGHAALHLGLLVADVGPGDEVIVPALTHLADVQAVRAVGAEPVICDIDDETLCIDPAEAARLIGPRTRAVIAMDYGPHLCDYGAIDALAREHGLRVVHDAAHSFGSLCDEEPLGSFSDLCVFSFDAVKALTCIDGGILVVQSEEDMARVRGLRVLGSSFPAERAYEQQRIWHYDAKECGFRYHLSNVHAAVGLAQLAKLDYIRETRQAAIMRYATRLAGVDGLRLPVADVRGLNPFLYYVRVLDGARDEFRQYLAERGVETGVHWTPVHQLELLRTCRRGRLDVIDRVAEEIVSLPLHSGMTEGVVDKVCDAVLSYFVTGPAPTPSAGTPDRTHVVPRREAAPIP